MKQSYPHCNMKYCLSCFCSSQSSQAGSDICSVCCSHPNPTGSEQHPPCTAISHRHQRVRTFRVIHPRAVSIFSSEQTLLISCLCCVYQVGGGGTPLIPQALPLCLPDPQHPFEQSQRHSSWSEDAELWLHPHLGGRGALWEAEAPPGWALGTWQVRDRAVSAVPAWCIPTAACQNIFCDFHPLALLTVSVVYKIK